MDRRMFLKIGTAGTAAFIAGTGYAQAATPAAPPMVRTLGRTGMQITPISFGAMRTEEPAIFRAAFDMGINYIDTARTYLQGRNEGLVGEAIRDCRDKVYLATKVKPNSAKFMRQSIADSLAALKQDYVDVLQLHDVSSKEGVMNPEYREVLAEAKSQGKTKFIGITIHKNEAATVDAVVDDPDKFFDVILVKYNFKESSPDTKAAIARAAQAGIGVIAMKTQCGGYETKELGDISPHQAALKFVLNDPNITAAIPSMVDLNQLKENFAVMGMPLTQADLEILDRYAAAIAPYYCHQCAACTGSCPFNVDIPTINRCFMYAQGYRDVPLARASYKDISPERGLNKCRLCSACTAQCPRGINLAERIQQARTLFA